MSTSGPFQVIVSRVNEGLHDDPDPTMRAVRVTLDRRGSLSIFTDHGSQTFTGWDEFTVRRIQPDQSE